MSEDNKKPALVTEDIGTTNLSMGEVVYATRYYDVVLLDDPVVLQPSYELATYGIYNKMTGVVEIELCVFPAAIHTAQNFSTALEEYFPAASVRDALSVVTPKPTFAEDLKASLLKVWEDGDEDPDKLH